MSMTESFISIWIPSIILIIGVVDDIYFRKFHNWLFLSLFTLALCFSVFFNGLDGITKGMYAVGLVLAITLPLVLLGIIGAGDMKLLMVFAIATNAHAVFNVIVISFLWGGFMGLMYVVISGQLIKFLYNLKGLIFYQIKPIKSSLHVIPYTIPLFLAWLTHISLTSYGVRIWS